MNIRVHVLFTIIDKLDKITLNMCWEQIGIHC